MNKNYIDELRSSSRDMVRGLGFLNNTLEGLNYGATHIHILIELDKYGTLTTQELAVILRINKSTVSRTVTPLIKDSLIQSVVSQHDRRSKKLELTSMGKKTLNTINQSCDYRVSQALSLLFDFEKEKAIEGVRLYAHALSSLHHTKKCHIREIETKDNLEVKKIVKTVLPEFGAVGPGYAIVDHELEDMFTAYKQKNSQFFVVERDNIIIGCGGYAPLMGVSGEICELRKMYLLPEARGFRLGLILLRKILDSAKNKGFQSCYLETLSHMNQAKRLYKKFGFKELSEPIVDTGHYKCDSWFIKDLS